jgi:nucleoside-diphosphate-sugar epimerase
MARSGVLPVVGRGSAAYTFVHVADVVRAIAAAVDRAPDGTIVFVGHPEPVTAREMLERVRAAAEGRAPIVRVPRPILWLAAVAGDISGAVGRQPALITTRRFVELTAPGFVCRVDRLREELGVEPAVGLSEGLRESAPWYLSQI